MKTKIFLALLIVFTLISIYRCDKIEEPFFKPVQIEQSAIKVILEDFTGHRCGNCPKAHRELESIMENYGENVIPIAVHNSDHFTDTNGDYPTDFTCSAANALGELFNVTSKPKGMVNRKGAEGSKLKSYSEWSNLISSALTQTPTIGIVLKTVLKEKVLKVDAFIKMFEEQDTALYLQLYILENHIIADQEDYTASPSHIEEYEHNHVLRAAINGDMGELLQKAPIKKDKRFEIHHQYTLKSEWQVQNLTIVAFVYNEKTKEILQAEAMNLQEE